MCAQKGENAFRQTSLKTRIHGEREREAAEIDAGALFSQ